MLTLKNNDYLKKYVEINFIKIAKNLKVCITVLIHKHNFTIQYVEYVQFRPEYLTLGQRRNMQILTYIILI